MYAALRRALELVQGGTALPLAMSVVCAEQLLTRQALFGAHAEEVTW